MLSLKDTTTDNSIMIDSSPFSLSDTSMVWLCQQMKCQIWFELRHEKLEYSEYFMTDQMNNATYISLELTGSKSYPHFISYQGVSWITILVLWIVWTMIGCCFIYIFRKRSPSVKT